MNYWSESSQHLQRQELSHWRGVGRWSDEQRWLAVGREHRELTERFCTLNGRSISGATVLEWGPGGGSNVLAFLPDVRQMYGVDISQSNLDECKRQIAGEYQSRSSQYCLTALPQKRSLIRSRRQLISSSQRQSFNISRPKEYGERVLGVLATLMSPGACAMVQIRYDDGRVKYLSKSRAYRKQAVTFTSYALHEFWTLLCRNDFSPSHITLQPRNNYAFYYFTRSSLQQR